ncbi:hypothetical protein MTR67_052740 [Solanum verrucosum]|uniref:RING-type E3 ubiquitin transferase n=1 Tax=Solanum verrucosum TaxID=315347 RepID=A0AAF0V7F8_SOLVR|nr:hypothetical protein MTR67_052740 [Solanum verrucosum]
MQRRTITTNTIFQNEATYDFGHVRTMTSAAHRSRIFYIRPKSHCIGFVGLQDQTENVNTGLSREVIYARMNHIMYQSIERSTSGDNDTCSICLDDYSNGQIIGSADCHHTFHFDCISLWIMQKNSCHFCKRIALAI